MKKTVVAFLATGIFIAAEAGFVQASTASWTDWTGVSAVTSAVYGTLNISGSIIDVTYTGPYSFAQLNGLGTNYWTNASIYESATVSNAPSTPDIIALNTGSTTKTITFSQPVVDPILALVSWNGNTVDFGVPITILSYGAGYWGSGTPVLNAAGTGFYGNGEVHGTIELLGTYSSITFSDTSENWHGFTVGAIGVPTSPTPEPATLLLFGTGIAGLAGLRTRRRK